MRLFQTLNYIQVLFKHLNAFLLYRANSQAADLMGSNSVAPVFLGFSSATGANNSDNSQLLMGELLVITKKLEKRDATTKKKAAEELNVHLEKNVDDVYQLLPYWAPIYHKKIVDTVKKKIAPHLKDLLGPWLNSVYDYNNEIAKVAGDAFHDTFPEGKRKDVVKFCINEIMQYVYDNLIIRSVDTMSDPRFASPEEMVIKYSRVVSGCLLSLQFVLSMYLDCFRFCILRTVQNVFPILLMF